MPTKLALDDDVAAKNTETFVVQPQKIGALKADYTLDKISAVLEEAEGPLRQVDQSVAVTTPKPAR